MYYRASIVGLSVAIMAMAGVAQSASRIGVTAATTNQVTGAMGGPAKRLRTGDGIFQNQVIRTKASSTAQLLFADETALTVGPASRVKLDKFVYNPNKKVGNIVFSATKGAFRFVTGNAKSRSYKITTPFASIGVRGTIFDGFLTKKALIVILVEGGVDVRTRNGKTIRLNRPGNYVIVRADGSTLGPAAWSGSLWNVAVGVPYPLFGRNTINNFSDLPVDPQDLDNDIGGGSAPDPGGPSSPGGVIIKTIP